MKLKNSINGLSKIDKLTKNQFCQSVDISMIYGKRELPCTENSAEMIKKFISSQKTFMIGRLGETEQRVIAYGLSHKFPIMNPWKKRRILTQDCWNWCEGAGFFPRNVNLIPDFTEVYLEAFSQVDVLAVWGLDYEQFLLERFMPQALICRARALSPYGLETKWTRALKGKRVLVISPFAKSIEAQYKRREKIHKDSDLLPDFELKTIQAVQSPYIMGEKSKFKNWFQALDWMYEETLKIDYDIALLGCGAYAFPLATKIKESGHGAITTCGNTQLLFGIMGKRWDTKEFREQAGVNEYWVHPGAEETPRGKSKVEEGCYW